jgi:hypothetical protein
VNWERKPGRENNKHKYSKARAWLRFSECSRRLPCLVPTKEEK